MWLTLDLDGIITSLRIRDYQKVPKDDCEKWCKVDFSFACEEWLDYSMEDDEVFLCSEIDTLIDLFEKLLTDQLTKPTEFGCVEPDFSFKLYPKKDLRDDPKYTHVQPGFEIVDIAMEWKISFWHEGLTANWLTVTLGRQDIEHLLLYLRLVSGSVSLDDPMIMQLIQNDIITEE